MFGPHEDAMLADNWHLAHSVLSPYLNLGLLLPGEVCDRVEKEFRAGRVPINSAEGFIRQIIGWREYVWNLYWRWMPEYATLNALDAQLDLPPLFTGAAPTHMRCVSGILSDIEARLGGVEVGLGLIELVLHIARVELHDEIARPDDGAGLDRHLDDLARRARLDLDDVDRLDLAGGFSSHDDVAALDHGGLDRGDLRWLGATGRKASKKNEGEGATQGTRHRNLHGD
jgi:hypothetical protein